MDKVDSEQLKRSFDSPRQIVQAIITGVFAKEKEEGSGNFEALEKEATAWIENYAAPGFDTQGKVNPRSRFCREDFEEAGLVFDKKLTARIGDRYNEWFYDPPETELFGSRILGCNYETGMVRILTGQPGQRLGNKTLFEGVIKRLEDLNIIWKAITDAQYLAYKRAKSEN